MNGTVKLYSECDEDERAILLELCREFCPAMSHQLRTSLLRRGFLKLGVGIDSSGVRHYVLAVTNPEYAW